MTTDRLTTLVAEIRLDENPLRRSLSGLKSSISGLCSKIGADIGRQFADAFATSMKVGLAGAIAGAVASIKVAADKVEIESKMGVVFDGVADKADKMATDMAKSVGRSAIDIKEAMSGIGAILKPSGFGTEAALDMSRAISQLAIDMGSFSNTSDAEAMTALTAGLIGEAEPLRRYGVLLSEASTNAELLRMGIAGGAKAATDAQKIQARFNQIVSQTTLAQGDAARTSGSFANSWKALGGAVRDLAGDLGTVFIPAATAVVQSIRESVSGLSQYRDQFAEVGRAIGSVIGNFGTAWELAYTSIALWMTKAYDKTATVFDAIGKLALGGVEGIVAAVKSLARDFVGVLANMADVARTNAKLIAAEVASIFTHDTSGVSAAAAEAAAAQQRLGKSLAAPMNAADAMQAAWAKRVSTIRDTESPAQKILQGDVDRLANKLAEAWNATGASAAGSTTAPPAATAAPAALDVASLWSGVRDAAAGIWGSVAKMNWTMPEAATTRTPTTQFMGLADYAKSMQSAIGGSPEQKIAKQTEKNTGDALPFLKVIADAGKATVDAILKPKPAVAT